ncbi:hypothetical protein EDD27_7854 [Nonomuraea polychroma]|uniref:Uncharacterized protein n=1 Tax=Nonomuraea polychroma TaxID=46176 RepID=A0A438MH20_9ACTN|nr:Yae1 family protein [Nonomuraea polychroma]RVX45077.1 hypothetical protein EDD27_7854 [Nonomuraea polychroma]
MPSPQHDSLLQLFRDRPRLAVDILRDLLGVELPATPPVCLQNARPSGEIDADLVIVLGKPQTPAHAIIVEVQQDKSKAPRQLARNAAALWLRLGCDVTTLVICPDRAIAAHYAQPIDSGLTGYRLQAQVLETDNIPAITDYSESAPEIRSLREIMTPTAWPAYNPVAREHYGRGFEDGQTIGRAEGIAEGRVEGRADGKAEEAARLLLLVLAARGLDVPDDTTTRITTCTNLAQLETWATRAATAETLQDLFNEPNGQPH